MELLLSELSTQIGHLFGSRHGTMAHVHQWVELPLDNTVLPGSQPIQPELQIESALFFDTSASSPDSPPPPTATSSKPWCKRSNKNAVSFLPYIVFVLISAQTKLMEWIGYWDSCLNELLWQDGHSDFIGQSACSSCSEEEGVYKCRDCFTGCQLWCSECMVSAHLNHPLHGIKIFYIIFTVLNATDVLSF